MTKECSTNVSKACVWSRVRDSGLGSLPRHTHTLTHTHTHMRTGAGGASMQTA
jgi:hypothetical protein